MMVGWSRSIERHGDPFMDVSKTIVKVGQVWSRGKPGISEYEITRISEGTVYARTHPNGEDSRFGWVKEDGTPRNWDNGWIIVRTTDGQVHGKSAGEYCAVCRQFFSYAVPNRPSGKLVCYSCRQGWIPKDL